MKSIFHKCRIWETHFQVIKALPSLPQPYVTVLEKQSSPIYHLEQRAAKWTESAMLRVTIKGEGALRVKDKIHPLPPGTAYFVRDADPDVSYYYPSHAKGKWIFLWFGFRGPCVPKMAEEINERYGYVFKLPLESSVVKRMESMESMKGATQALSPMAGAKIVMDVLSELGDVIEKPQLERPNVELARTAQKLILENLEKGVTVEEVARRLDVSREHLSRTFKELTGRSPLEFATEERMQMAIRALSGGRISSKELAEKLGYDSPSSFSRAFKRRFGKSPTGMQKVER